MNCWGFRAKSSVETNCPWRRRFRCWMPNQNSIWLSQEAGVGVNTNRQREWWVSYSCRRAVLWTAKLLQIATMSVTTEGYWASTLVKNVINSSWQWRG